MHLAEKQAVVLVEDLAKLVGSRSDEDAIDVSQYEQELALSRPLLDASPVAEHASEPPVYANRDQYAWGQANESAIC
jgi:hypothetical protein